MLASVASMIDQFNMPNISILREQGYEVHVAANFEFGSTSSKLRVDTFKKELNKLGIPYYNINFSRKITHIFSHIRAYKQIKKLIYQNKYEFIHCHSPIGGVCGRIAAHGLNTKVIYTAHGFHFFKGAPIKNWLIYYPVEKFLAKYTDVLITINKEDFKRALKFKAKKVEYVPGVGINLNKFIPQTLEQKKLLRKKYGYNQNDFILIYVAELSYRKNQEMLINAVNVIKDEIKDVKLLIVGIGDMLESYAQLVRRLNIEKNVEFLGFRNDVASLMAISDVAVSTSRQEGLPVNVMEAMATRLPLIVTSCRGNRDLVIDGENGIVVELDDANKFANGILTLYQSSKLRDEYGERSLELVKQYSTQNVMLDMAKIYKGN